MASVIRMICVKELRSVRRGCAAFLWYLLAEDVRPARGLSKTENFGSNLGPDDAQDQQKPKNVLVCAACGQLNVANLGWEE
jgi:hypothetical protein